MAGTVGRRAVLAGAGALAAAWPGAAHAEGRVVAMKFAMRGQQPVTTVFVKGKGPFLMLVDTGNAGDSFLRPAICEKLGLTQIGETRIYGATGTDTVFGYMAHDVVVGQVAREPDMVFAGSDRVPGGLDGILSAAFFSAYPTDFDFIAGEIRIQASGGIDRSGFRPVRCDHARREDGRMIAPVQINGIPARLIVDTGAATTVGLTPRFVAAHGLWKADRYMDTQIRGITSRIGDTRLVRTPSVKIGPFKFQDVPIRVGDPRQTVAIEEDGYIGIELLERFTLGYDVPASTLWLKPNGLLADPYVYDHSGLTWAWKDGAAVVVKVGPGSPAEAAGAKPGDRIVGLDTEKAAYAWDRGLSGAPETKIPLELQRGAERIRVDMTLKDWL